MTERRFPHYGRDLTPETLATAVWQALQGRPQVPMALHPMEGETWLTELMERLAGHDLEDELRVVLEAGLETAAPSSTEIGVLAACLAAVPGWVTADALVQALRRTAGGDDGARARLARALAQAVRADGGGHREAIRELLGEPALRTALMGVAARLDPDWSVAQLAGWMTGDAAHDKGLFTWFARDLSRAQLDRVRAAAEGPGWPAGSAAVIGAYIDRVGELPHVAGLPAPTGR